MTRDYKQDDPRVIRTRNLIQAALVTLTIERGFANVTVRDIAEYAGINRATFYRHFEDKFDLLDQHIREGYNLLNAPIEAKQSLKSSKNDSDNSITDLATLLSHIQDNAQFYRVMFGTNGDPTFVKKVQHYIEKRLRHVLPDELLKDNNSANIYLSYVSCGSIGIIQSWLDNEIPLSPRELALLCFRLSEADLGAVMGMLSELSSFQSDN